MAPADGVMASAIARAREILPSFLETLRHPQPGASGFSVKVGVGAPKIVECIWLASPKLEGGDIVGRVSNTPRNTQAVSRGEILRVPLGAVIDWTYQGADGMMGNHTACALAARFSPADAREFQRAYRIDCARLLGPRT